MGRFQEYQVIGRKLPSDKEPQPKLYRMRIFAPNDVVAKSRFWYFLRKLRKVKKATGEVVAVNVVRPTSPSTAPLCVGASVFGLAGAVGGGAAARHRHALTPPCCAVGATSSGCQRADAVPSDALCRGGIARAGAQR